MLKLFHRAQRPEREKLNSVAPFYTALLSMVLCTLCLFGTTWAWFTANEEYPLDPIVSAQCTLDVTVTSSGQSVDVTLSGNTATFVAEENVLYEVEAKIGGTATEGFLLIDTCDGSFYSGDASCEFTLLLSQGGAVTLTASWGSETGNAAELNSGAQLGSGIAAEPVNESPAEATCTCTTKCAERNETCPVCAEHPEHCLGAEPEESELLESDEPTPPDTEEPPADPDPDEKSAA